MEHISLIIYFIIFFTVSAHQATLSSSLKINVDLKQHILNQGSLTLWLRPTTGLFGIGPGDWLASVYVCVHMQLNLCEWP